MTRPPGHRGQSRDAKTVKLIRECDLVRRRGTTTLSVEALADPGAMERAMADLVPPPLLPEGDGRTLLGMRRWS